MLSKLPFASTPLRKALGQAFLILTALLLLFLLLRARGVHVANLSSDRNAASAAAGAAPKGTWNTATKLKIRKIKADRGASDDDLADWTNSDPNGALSFTGSDAAFEYSLSLFDPITVGRGTFENGSVSQVSGVNVGAMERSTNSSTRIGSINVQTFSLAVTGSGGSLVDRVISGTAAGLTQTGAGTLAPSTSNNGDAGRKVTSQRVLAIGIGASGSGSVTVNGSGTVFNGTSSISPSAVTAVDYYWDLNGATAGAGTTPSGTWDTASNNKIWNINANGGGNGGSLDKWANTPDSNAVFSAGSDATGGYTVSLLQAITAGLITFEDGTVSLVSNVSASLTIHGGITVASTVSGDVDFSQFLTVNVAAAQSWTNNSSHTLLMDGPINLQTFALTVTGAGDTLINGSMTGTTASLTKSGAGTLTLATSNTYSGGTTVTGGKLLVNGTAATGSGAVTVNGSGTVLGGTGSISGSVTLGNTTPGAIINPGPSGTNGTAGAVGTLTVGALTLQGADKIHIDASGILASNWDKIMSTGAIALGSGLSTLELSIASGLNFPAGNKYTLLSGTSLTGTFAGITDGATVMFGSYRFTADYTSTGFDLIVPIPETSSWLAAALTAIVLASAKRTRRLFARRKS